MPCKGKGRKIQAVTIIFLIVRENVEGREVDLIYPPLLA
jgi:hypothetical protein